MAAACILVSLTMLFLPGNFKITFARKALNALFYPGAKAAHFLGEYDEVRDENRRLKRMVASLMHERERLIQFREERKRLRRFAELKEEQHYRLLSCEVIERKFDRFQNVILIDRGMEDSLKAKMPVLSYQGYIGRIVDVFRSSSSVQLISSRNSPVSCLDKRSRVVGILEWKTRSNFELKEVGITDDIQKGDSLITSGFGGVVPKGFFIGVVTKVTADADGVTRKVSAVSPLNLRSLEEVFVITDEMPWEKGIFYDEKDKAVYREITGGR